MLKSALICSAVCTAFVVGDYSLAATPQNKATQAVKPVVLRQVLIPLIGKKCGFLHNGDLMRLSFRKEEARDAHYTLDAVGIDFVRVSDKGGTVYAHMSTIYLCTD